MFYFHDFVEYLITFSIILFTILCISILLRIKTKRRHINKMVKGLGSIIATYGKEEEDDYSNENFHLQVERFYNQYVENNPSAQKTFPNIAVWIDSIAMIVNLKINPEVYIAYTSHYKMPYLKAFLMKFFTNKYILGLYECMTYIIDLQNHIHNLYPYCKVTPYQQYLLKDIYDLQQNNSVENTRSIIQKIESEFLRQEYSIKKNDKINKISIFVGVLGIAVSIILALINFA